MSTPLLIFLGIQLVSFAIVGAILFEHWRVCKHREEIFQHLGDRNRERRRRRRLALITFYLLTTLCIALVPGYFFFLSN
jgi:nitrate reductase NapE component